MLELDSGKSVFLTRNMLISLPYFLPYFDIILMIFLATQTVKKKKYLKFLPSDNLKFLSLSMYLLNIHIKI